MEAKGMAKNIPIKPKSAPKTNTEYRIANGCRPNFSPITFGERKYPSSKKDIRNIKIA